MSMSVNMKKIALCAALLLCGALLFGSGGTQKSGTTTPAGGAAAAGGTTGPAVKTEVTDAVLNQLGLTRSGKTFRFKETRNITVEVFDRGLDGGKTKPEDNFYTKWIKAGVLRDLNINVTFKPVSRWTETDELNNLLAAGSAPDVCVTYGANTILAYANMGGVLDLDPYINKYPDLFPNIWDWLGDGAVNYDKQPKTGKLWNIRAILSSRMSQLTMIRQDWLKKLNLAEPRTLDAYHDVLVAFRDNAQTLLGADARMMVPLMLTQDVGWYAFPLIISYLPSAMTDRDYYVYGFDDRHLGRPGSKGEIAVKSAARVLNQWYNENLIWKDFYLYPDGDSNQDNLLKAGYVGSYMQNWDYPYRNGAASVSASLHANVGPDADYLAATPFPNDSGKPWLPGGDSVDRCVFFPASNKEPVASLLYLDWVHTVDNLFFIQFGEEGVTHERMSDGAVRALATTGDKILNSPLNIDYTTLINGLRMPTQDLMIKSWALSYPETDPALVMKAIQDADAISKIFGHAVLDPVDAEEGMQQVLKVKRDNMLAKAVQAAPGQFDAIFDAGYNDWLASGGQAIIDARIVRWREGYGDKTSVK